MKKSRHTAAGVNGAHVYRYFAHTGGWRFVVLFHRGRKWLKVLETERLEVRTLKVIDAHTLRPYDGVAPKKLAKRIRSRRAGFKRLDLAFPERAVARAIATLEDSYARLAMPVRSPLHALCAQICSGHADLIAYNVFTEENNEKDRPDFLCEEEVDAPRVGQGPLYQHAL